MADEGELDLRSLNDDELVQQMHDDLYDGLKEEVEEGVNILLERKWTPYDTLTKGLVEGMRIVGIDFRDGILFVPEVLLAANAMKAGMFILRPLLAETGAPKIGKMIIGSVFTIAGALCLVMAAATQGGGKIGLFWPVMFHLLNSIGFAHTLPVSLALFTRLAPRALNATVLGIYYLAFFAANKIVGEVGGWYSTMDTVQFWLLHVGTGAVGLVAFGRRRAPHR